MDKSIIDLGYEELFSCNPIMKYDEIAKWYEVSWTVGIVDNNGNIHIISEQDTELENYKVFPVEKYVPCDVPFDTSTNKPLTQARSFTHSGVFYTIDDFGLRQYSEKQVEPGNTISVSFYKITPSSDGTSLKFEHDKDENWKTEDMKCTETLVVDDVYDSDLEWGHPFIDILRVRQKYGWDNSVLQDIVDKYLKDKAKFDEEQKQKSYQKAKSFITTNGFLTYTDETLRNILERKKEEWMC